MSIGMIGLGAMGSAIARNMLRAGYELLVYDVRPEACRPLVDLGARAVSGLDQMGRSAQSVFMMVNSFDQCQSVVSGLLETMEGGTIVNMSTIAMSDAQTLARQCERKGVSMLDCPVSGGTAGAQEGSLTLMVAGSGQQVEAHRPILASFAGNIVHVGTQCGQGQAVKTINQLLVGVHMCAAAEAFTLARACGLDLEMMYETICTSAGSSRIFENRGRFAIERNFDTRSTLQIQRKDTDIVCRTAQAVGASVPMAATALDLFARAADKYPPTQDSLAVMRLYEELAGLSF